MMLFLVFLACFVPYSVGGIDYDQYYKRDYKTLIQITENTMGIAATFEQMIVRDGARLAHGNAMGAIGIHSNLGNFHYVYLTKAEEAFYVDTKNVDLPCVSNSIKDALPGFPPELQWNWSYSFSSSPDVIGPLGMLFYIINTRYVLWVEDRNPTTDQVRGINVKVYNNTFNEGKLKVVAYEQVDWTAPKKGYPGKNKVIKVTLKGLLPPDKRQVKNETLVDMSIEIFNIAGGITYKERKFLQIPSERGCKGTNAKFYKPLTHDTDFSVSGEIVGVAQNEDEDQRLAYTTNFNLISSHEFSTYQIVQDAFTVRSGKVIPLGTNKTIVFGNAGYKFTSNIEDGSCTVKTDELYGLPINLPEGDVLHFQSPSSLFNFTGYTYLETTKIRSIIADVYVKTVANLEGYMYLDSSLAPGQGAILTYYELSASTTHFDGQRYVKGQMPLKLEIRLFHGQLRKNDRRITINFFEFNAFGVSMVDIFNKVSIADCLEDANTRLWFQVQYKEVGQNTFKVDSKHVINAFIKNMNALNGINPLRIVNPTVTYQGNDFKVTAALLERPPAIHEFTINTSGMVFKNASSYPSYYLTLSNEDCAKKCLLYDRGVQLCKSYVWCDFICYLYVTKVPDKKGPVKSAALTESKSKDKKNCIFADRKLPSFYGSHNMKYNTQVIGDIENVVSNYFPGEKSKALDITKHGEHYLYHARWAPVSVTTNLLQRSHSIAGENELRDNFHLEKYGYNIDYKYVKTDFSETMTHDVTPNICASECRKDPDFYCETFSFCAEKHSCYLTDISPLFSKNVNKSEMHQNSDCAIYSRTYLDEYKEFDGIIMSAKGKKFKVNSPNDCAKKCIVAKDLGRGKECESFDVCYSEDSEVDYCILYDVHRLDLTSTDQVKSSEICNHYSKKYMKDYLNKGHFQLRNDYVLVYYKNIAVENCSKICSQTTNCTGFDFCLADLSTGSICSLTTKTSFGSSIFVNNSFCSIYQGIYHDNTAIPVYPTSAPIAFSSIAPSILKKPQKVTENANTTSAGVAIGIGILMMIIGAIISFGGIRFYFNRKTAL